jgi:predicted phage terminase large subunit-like protein
VPSVAAIEAEWCRRSLRAYMSAAWRVLEPGTPFVPNFHIDAIADHLEGVTRGQIRRLLITMPPRHMKSLAVSVFWPTWDWITAPQRRFLYASYARELSTRDSLKARRLIESPWYHRRWGDVYQLTSDQNVKQKFENDRTGYRLSTAVGAAVTGEGGDCVIVDDPHNVNAESDAVRKGTLRWWDEAVSTRLNDPRSGRFVIVQQRVHEDDLAGHVLDQGGYEHLCLPAEYDGRRTVTSLGWHDPRTEIGQLLWPARVDAPTLAALKRALGPYAAAGQLQQRPVPAGGGLFHRAWFTIVDGGAADRVVRRCRFWDCAATEGGGDWTVGVLLGETAATQYYVEDVVRGQWSASDVDRIMRQTAERDGPRVRIREEQEPGSAGKAVVTAHLRLLTGFDYKGVPAAGEKTTRWRPLAAQAEPGHVFVVRGAWNAEWLDELTMAPFGKHDDQVDATAGAFSELALGHRGIGVVKITGF